MVNTASDIPAPEAQAGAAAELSFRRQLAIAGASFWASPVRNRILLLAAALLAIILLTAYGQILLNRWNALDPHEKEDVANVIEGIVLENA